METKLNKAQPIWKRTWFRYLGAFIIVQLLFIICEVTAWAPNFRPGGEFFNRVLNSQFSQNGSRHIKSLILIYLQLFAITLLPYALISAIKDFTTRKNINN